MYKNSVRGISRLGIVWTIICLIFIVTTNKTFIIPPPFVTLLPLPHIFNVFLLRCRLMAKVRIHIFLCNFCVISEIVFSPNLFHILHISIAVKMYNERNIFYLIPCNTPCAYSYAQNSVLA